MTLAVIIVNYNVKYFLKQCLASVYGSQRRLAVGSELELEVWVVDNDSVDDSLAMVGADYPEVHIIENHQNADGSINIPAALQPYMGGVQKIG